MLDSHRLKETALKPEIGFKHEQTSYAACLLYHSSYYRLIDRVKLFFKTLLVVFWVFPGQIQVINKYFACKLQAQWPPGLLIFADPSVCPEVLTLIGLKSGDVAFLKNKLFCVGIGERLERYLLKYVEKGATLSPCINSLA